MRINADSGSTEAALSVPHDHDDIQSMTTKAATPGLGRDVILVEDDDALRRSLQLLLIGQGYHVLAFSQPEAAIASSASLAAACLVIDYVLPRHNGIETLRMFRAKGWQGRAVLITAFHSPGLQDAAAEAGFAAVLPKPFRTDDLGRAMGDG